MKKRFIFALALVLIMGLSACGSTVDTSTGISSAVSNQSSVPADTSTPANDENNREEEPIQEVSAEPAKPVAPVTEVDKPNTDQTETPDLSPFPTFKENLKKGGIDPDNPDSIKSYNDKELEKLKKEKGVETTVKEIEENIIKELERIDNLVKKAEQELTGYDKAALNCIKETAEKGPGTVVTFPEQKALTSQLISRLAYYAYTNGSFPLTFEDMDVKDLETGGSKNTIKIIYNGIFNNWIIGKNYEGLQVVLVDSLLEFKGENGVNDFAAYAIMEGEIYTIDFEVVDGKLKMATMG